MYRAYLPTEGRWIHIVCAGADPQEPDAFLRLVKCYNERVSGRVVALSGEMQYRIDTDALGLVFQWDACFGITVIVPESSDLYDAYNTLVELCGKLGDRQQL